MSMMYSNPPLSRLPRFYCTNVLKTITSTAGYYTPVYCIRQNFENPPFKLFFDNFLPRITYQKMSCLLNIDRVPTCHSVDALIL